MDAMTAPTPVKPHAEPLSIDGGRIGVLLSHGFTGSPASMKPWGQDLADHGFTVRVPRLPGHGTHWRDLNRVGWDDWYAELDSALSELRAACDHVDWVRYLITPAMCVRPSISKMSPGLIRACNAAELAGVNGS